MPRTNRISLQNSFGRGLITEASPLSFPENACTNADNCVFSPYGVSERRLGFDLESNFDTETIVLDGKVVTAFLWKDVASLGDTIFNVVQMGDTLHFYRAGSGASLSASKHADTVDLIDFAPVGVTSVATLECQFASGNGLLFVTNRRLNSFYVEYDPVGDNLTATEIDIQTRDFEGDPADPFTVSQRPTSSLGSLDGAHRYNLENQGWSDANLTAWDSARSDLPSNSDVEWYFKNTSNAFDFSTVGNRSIGNSEAPKGHFIFSIYDIDRASEGGTTSIDTGIERVSTCSFFAGRVFYAGVQYSLYNSRLFFSQIVESKSQYGMCYQKNDPTAEESFELLPSDGGVIDIIGAGSILKMVPVLNTLLIFATNGVWAITGSQGIGFTANDYSINQISSISNLSHTSFVDVEGTPFWWNSEGIYTVSLDPQSNAMRTVSITDPSIRNFFLDIPLESKQYARGIYDQFTKQIQWIYKSRTSSSFGDKYVYDRLLTFNLLSKGFYPWSVSDENVKIHSITNVISASTLFEEETVVDGADTVVDGGETVIAFISSTTSLNSAIKFLVSYVDGLNTEVTFAECFKDTYLDWETVVTGGESYESFFVTGYKIGGGGLRKFQTNYVNIFNLSDVNSSYKIRSQWGFSTDPNSGKWSGSQVFNVSTDHFLVKPNKIKLRGHGLTCQFRIENNSNNPFFIVGWSVLETGNQWI